MHNDKPQVTLFLFAYKQQDFVRAAVESALAQDYENLHIILSDDASPDNTYSIMEEVAKSYNGPHTIQLNKNSVNLGLIEHVNFAMQSLQGELLILAAGDDISHTNRCNELVNCYLKTNALLIHSKATAIDITGTPTGAEEPNLRLQRGLTIEEAATARGIYLGASGAWSRELIEKFGRIKFNNSHEDAVMGFRALLENRMEFINQPLLSYRIGNGLSHAKPTKGTKGRQARVKDIQTQIDILKQRAQDITPYSQYSDTAKAILRRIDLLSIKLDFYNKKRMIINHLLKSPLLTLRALPSEIRLELLKFRI